MPWGQLLGSLEQTHLLYLVGQWRKMELFWKERALKQAARTWSSQAILKEFGKEATEEDTWGSVSPWPDGTVDAEHHLWEGLCSSQWGVFLVPGDAEGSLHFGLQDGEIKLNTVLGTLKAHGACEFRNKSLVWCSRTSQTLVGTLSTC